MDFDICLRDYTGVEYDVTLHVLSFGSRPSWDYHGGDPGDPFEWEVISAVSEEGEEVPWETIEGNFPYLEETICEQVAAIQEQQRCQREQDDADLRGW